MEENEDLSDNRNKSYPNFLQQFDKRGKPIQSNDDSPGKATAGRNKKEQT